MTVLVWLPRHPTHTHMQNPGVLVHFCYSNTKKKIKNKQVDQITESHYPSSLVKWLCFRFNEQSCLQNLGEEFLKKTFENDLFTSHHLVWPHTYMHIHLRAYKDVHAYITYSCKKHMYMYIYVILKKIISYW